MDGFGNESTIQGKVKSELAKEYSAQELSQLLSSDDINFKPGGDNAESIAMVRQRMNEFVSDIMAKHRGQTVLVFAHGGVISSLMTQVLIKEVAPDKHYRAFFVKNCAINVLAYINEEDKWYVDRLGDDDFTLLDDYTEDGFESAEDGSEDQELNRLSLSMKMSIDNLAYLCVGLGLGFLLGSQMTQRQLRSNRKGY